MSIGLCHHYSFKLARSTVKDSAMTRWLVPISILLVWALWFGGEMTLFLSVIALFGTDRSLGFQAAPVLFHAFEKYQIFLSLLAVLLGVIGFAITRRKPYLIILGLFWAATICALVSTLAITPEIVRLREAGLTGTDQFKSAHGKSMWLYVAEAVALLLAGLIIPMLLTNRRADTTPPASAPQA